ncbi:MAG: hypothetical protein AB8U15_03205 [Rickettsiales endosymbiont of Dermacentor nuttalli]
MSDNLGSSLILDVVECIVEVSIIYSEVAVSLNMGSSVEEVSRLFRAITEGG